ncbi:Protein SOSEKI 1 [Coemansia spiralis]|uniref:Protein SOSEKI 1 n=1 Tax=Coemansia spiralis TaxID=417178 RepID=A0A9W8GPX4_9FUNG|nr:Protein SOSEKI 1 [Coemansia spiralis]
MSESYTRQDNDYLSATHHTQAASAAGHGDSTDFLSKALSTSRAGNSSPGSPGSGGVGIAGSGSGADCGNGAAGPMSLSGMVASAAADDASCAGAPLAASGPLSQSPAADSAGAGGDAAAAAGAGGAGAAIADGVRRGTKRRGSEPSAVFMAIGSGTGHPQSAYSTQTAGSAAAVCSGRKRRSLGVSPPESPAPLSPPATQACAAPPPALLPAAARRLLLPQAARRSADSGGNLRRTLDGRAAPRDADCAESQRLARARAASSGDARGLAAGDRRAPPHAAASREGSAPGGRARGPEAAPLGTPSQSPIALGPAGLSGAGQHAAIAAGTAPAPPKAAAACAAGHRQAPACTLPPINRYTLRELKIQNILQNPRLRHEVLFEPKLEFRPNSSGQLADAKQRAVATYWAAVDQGLRRPSAAATTLVMLLVELREILAEMAEDSPRAELSSRAPELRERLDEERLRQQIAHGVFDAEPVVRYLATVMRAFAQAAQREGAVHDAAIARVLAYVQRGRVVRALRAAFDVLEAIKIDTANGSIELYREYMRSTAVAFERSHFSLALQRSSLSLADTAEWWRRAVAGDGAPLPDAAASATAAGAGAGSLDAVFAEAGREMVLDEGQPIPGLFRMDEGRILAIRREAERLAIVGMVFLAFSQFLQAAALASAGVAPVMGEFRNANGRVEYERLAAECLLIVPEGCSVKWTEPLIVAKPAAPKGGLGEVGFSHLVSELVLLAERVLGRLVTCAEVAMLERTLLRTARYECPLREVVEERVSGAVRLHTAALTALNGKVSGTECEAMPLAARDLLRRSMLLFLAPSLSALSLRIHAVVSHHWLVYKSFYASSLSSPLQPFPSLSPL